MKVKKSNIKDILLTLLGLLIICFTLWNRLLRGRLPKNIHDFNNPYIKIFIIITSIISIITIIFTLWQKFKPKKTSSKLINYLLKFTIIEFFVNILFKIAKSLDQGPKTVYKRLIYDQYNISHILEIPFVTLAHILEKFQKNIYIFILTTIHCILHTIPRFLPPIIFIVEIYLYNQLHYFYKSLFLYLIAMAYSILLWILKDLVDSNIYYTTAHIEITYHPEACTVIFRKEIPIIEDAVDIVDRKNDHALLKWFVYIYETYTDICLVLDDIDLIRAKFKDFERIFSSTLFLIGWLYVLFTIL